MSTTIAVTSLRPQVRPVSDLRPPGLTWARSAPAPSRDQPPLAFEPSKQVLGRPRPSGHRVLVVAPPPERAAAELPDPRSWSASLALALAEALQGRRPVGQLSRWVDERVLATVTVALRHRQHPSGHPASGHHSPSQHSSGPDRMGRPAEGSVPPARLRSVHLQYPQPDAVEAAAHVQVGDRSTALAFRLIRWYDRWLCTELELGPRHSAL